MQKLLFLCLLLTGIYRVASAQTLTDKEIPAKVKKIFHSNYPAAKDPQWYKEDKNFEVKFLQTKVEYTILYDKEGNMLQTELGLGPEKLPTEAKNYLKKNYAGKKVDDVSKVTNGKGVTTYRVYIDDKELLFDALGKFEKEVDPKD